MINITNIISGLYKRLGWREPTKTGYAELLDTDNKASGSGLYFQDYSPLVTVENVKESQPDSGISDANFNAYLDNLQKSVILKVINSIYKERDDFIEEQIVYDNENVITKTIDTGTDFVGYEVNVAKLGDIAVKLNTLILEFDGVATFNVYLYHSADQDAIKTQSVTTVANEAKIQSLTDWILYYDSASIKGGKYYIGYYQSDLGSVKAINRNWGDAALMSHAAMYDLIPLKATPNGVKLFDLDDISYEGDTFGLNFDITVRKDYTQQVVDNVSLFDNAIGYGMAVECLKLIINSGRSNRSERMAKGAIAAFAELYGIPPDPEMPRIVGVEKTLNIEIKRIKKALFSSERIKTRTLK